MSSHTITTFRYDPAAKRFFTEVVERQLGLDEVLIKVTHSGICYTDVHAKDKGCGLGHEGVGSIVKVGDAVKGMKIGDRVGWGWLRSSCGHCPSCLDGYRQYCAQARGFAFCDLDQGAFADYHIISAAFAYRIPETISSLHAGVFMCAGASTYEALIAAGTKPSDRVGVVGLGGLGHMAVLFAKAMGCAVSVISNSAFSDRVKLSDAFELGADEVRPTKPPGPRFYKDVYGAVNPDCTHLGDSDINVLLVCANQTPDFKAVLPLLARRAVIVLMGIQTEELRIPYMPFLLPGHRIISSTEASTRNHADMIEFAARHGIKPWVHSFEMTEEGLSEAFSLLENGRMRFRGVVVAPY